MSAALLPFAMSLAEQPETSSVGWAVVVVVVVLLLPLLVLELLGMRYIPNNRVGIVEKLWSGRGSVPEGRIIALNGEAGYQADVLRGGAHFGLWRWQYRIHKLQLVTVPQGKIGYVYARDGEPLAPSQTLGRVIPCNNFQDARAFLGEGGAEGEKGCGQRGRQRAILREGVYAINLALFVVITEDAVYRLPQQEGRELETLLNWQKELRRVDGFRPVVIGGAVRTPEAAEEREEEEPRRPRRRSEPAAVEPVGAIAETVQPADTIGIVTVQDGPSLNPGEIIAPPVGTDANDPNYHNNFQDPEAFLRAGGRRGRQYVTLTDGTYFINRWFATVEIIPKTVVPIGY
ncbi:MAG TPA: hypothetical protein VFA26_01390, partial [Gemmataceae bacterium]|nr:hypothetical protein [Gemmataceae bacterium]